jgi:thymidylate kinase
MVIVLNGVHTAGKSTVGTRLAAHGLPYYPEIADWLIETWGFSGSLTGTERFQREVHAAECVRDRVVLAERTCVVETWHPGNLAHTMAMGASRLATTQRSHLQQLADRGDVRIVGLFLDIPVDRIPERSDRFDQDDREALQFYREVSHYTRRVYDRVGMEYIEIDGTAPVESVTAAALKGIQQLAGWRPARERKLRLPEQD